MKYMSIASREFCRTLLLFLVLIDLTSCARRTPANLLISDYFQMDLPEDWVVFQKDIQLESTEFQVAETATGISSGESNASFRIRIIYGQTLKSHEEIRRNWIASIEPLVAEPVKTSHMSGFMTERIVKVFDEDLKSERDYYLSEWLMSTPGKTFILKYGSFFDSLYTARKTEILECLNTLKPLNN